MAPIGPNSLVLISGVSGFLGIWCTFETLERGHRVRGTVRSAEKGEYVKNLFEKRHPGKFEYVIAEDLEAPGVFDEHVKGVDGVLHTASPFHFNVEDDPQGKLIKPAVQGTLSILNSIEKNGDKVKRVVITSSFAAILDRSKKVPYEFDEKDWNDSDPKESDEIGAKQNGMNAYRSSKSKAERAAWDFLEARPDSKWDLATINPPLIIGPFIHQVSEASKLNTSIAQVNDLLEGKKDPETYKNPAGAYVDVRNVAQAHVAALNHSSGNGRFAISAGGWTWQDAADAVLSSKKIPQSIKDKVAKGETGAGKNVVQNSLNNSKSKEVLGMNYIMLQESLEASAASLQDYNERKWKGMPREELIYFGDLK